MSDELVIVGAGGHGKVVAATAQAMGLVVRGFVDGDASKHGTSVFGLPVLGSDADILKPGVHAVLAIGSNRARRDVAQRFACVWQTLVHPTAYVHASCRLGAGTVVFAGAVIQPDTVLGEHVIINTQASVDHDNDIGSFVHIAPGSHLAGTVTVGEGAFIGLGVSVIPGRRIGAWSTVGSGAAVVRDVEHNSTVVGVPARLKGSRP